MGSGGGGSPGNQTVTQVSEPPEYVESDARSFLARARGLSQAPFTTFQGQRIAPLVGDQLNAIQGGRDALQTSLPVGAQTLTDTAGGAFLNANPFLNQTFDRAADQVQARMSNQMQGQGLSNSGVQEQYQRQLNDLATGIYGGNYQQERGRMNEAAAMLPGYAEQQAQLGLGLGDIQRELNQAGINEQIRQFEEARLFPHRNLDILGRAIGMSMGGGGTVTTTQPGFFEPSPTAGMLGGGLAALGLAQQLFGGNS